VQSQNPMKCSGTRLHTLIIMSKTVHSQRR
jgi:hypothetical protein